MNASLRNWPNPLNFASSHADKRMDVVFMGTPEFACPPLETLVRSRHNVLAVVTVPDKPAGRGRKLKACQAKLTAELHSLPIYQPQNLRDDSFIEIMAALKADVFVIIAFRILPKKLYSLPRKGAVNIHASLLPKYRGAAPINHAILNGETETGLTSFFLAKKIDQGDIIHRVSTPIDPDESFTSLSVRLSEMAGPFLLETLDLIDRPDFTPKRQDDSAATPAPKIQPEDGLLDWRMGNGRVHNHIRAFSERPGAYSFFNDQKIKILGSSVGQFPDLPLLEPGELYVHRKQLFVGAGDGPLKIITLQPEGKRVMDALSFINGYRISKNQKFNNRRKGVITD